MANIPASVHTLRISAPVKRTNIPELVLYQIKHLSFDNSGASDRFSKGAMHTVSIVTEINIQCIYDYRSIIIYIVCSSEIMKIWVDILESYFLYMQAKNFNLEEKSFVLVSLTSSQKLIFFVQF